MRRPQDSYFGIRGDIGDDFRAKDLGRLPSNDEVQMCELQMRVTYLPPDWLTSPVAHKLLMIAGTNMRVYLGTTGCENISRTHKYPCS